ncbi:hypothetical protein MMC10_010987 [Thelotrema lepadinum]|nr:hypothetical protein [Thelotrema lepadinum]
MLPQISHEDRAIRDAVLVISQLYEQPPVYAWTQVDAQERAHKFPVKWYTRSLSGFRSRMANLETPADYELALLSCLLFATIEFQQVNVSNACNLLQCGLSMIKDGYQRNAKSFTLPDSSLVRIRQMFARQRFLMAIFGHDTPGGFHDVSAALTHDSESSPVTLAKTKEELFDCLYDTMRLLQAARVAEVQQLHDRKDHLSIERASVLNNLELWHQNFSWVWQTRDMQGTLQDTQEEITANISLIYYETALCWTCTCLESEDTTDKYMSNFERIIELSEKVIQQKQELGLASTPFSFELGTIAPLWLTGWKCRDPDLRRKALQLLRRGSKQEALFSAPLHAKALEKVIEIEEKRGNVPSTRREGHIGWLSLPEPRVRNITVQYETKEGKKVEPALIYDIESSKSEGDLTLVQKTIPL